MLIVTDIKFIPCTMSTYHRHKLCCCVVVVVVVKHPFSSQILALYVFIPTFQSTDQSGTY